MKIYNSEIQTNISQSSDLLITTGENKTLILSSSVYDDIRIIPTTFDYLGNSDPTVVSYTPGGSGLSTRLYEFAKNDIGYFTVQLPHSYKLSSDLYVHVHWTPGARGTAESGSIVSWKVAYSWANINTQFPTMSIANISDQCKGINHLHEMTSHAIISGSEKGISSHLLCYVYRDSTGDTWVSNNSGQLPMLLEVDFHYEIDTIGSRKVDQK